MSNLHQKNLRILKIIFVYIYKTIFNCLNILPELKRFLQMQIVDNTYFNSDLSIITNCVTCMHSRNIKQRYFNTILRSSCICINQYENILIPLANSFFFIISIIQIIGQVFHIPYSGQHTFSIVTSHRIVSIRITCSTHTSNNNLAIKAKSFDTATCKYN